MAEAKKTTRPNLVANPNRNIYEPTRSEKALGVIVVGALFIFVGAGVKRMIDPKSPDRTPGPIKAMTHVVQAGDTEWSLANMISPNADTRAVVDEIDHLLPPDASHADHTLQPGDSITYDNRGDIIGYSEARPNSG